MEDPKKELVRGIVENQLNGSIPQKSLAKSVGNMSAGRFTEALDGLVDENVLGKPSYNPRDKEVVYTFNPDAARRKNYL